MIRGGSDTNEPYVYTTCWRCCCLGWLGQSRAGFSDSERRGLPQAAQQNSLARSHWNRRCERFLHWRVHRLLTGRLLWKGGSPRSTSDADHHRRNRKAQRRLPAKTMPGHNRRLVQTVTANMRYTHKPPQPRTRPGVLLLLGVSKTQGRSANYKKRNEPTPAYGSRHVAYNTEPHTLSLGQWTGAAQTRGQPRSWVLGACCPGEAGRRATALRQGKGGALKQATRALSGA